MANYRPVETVVYQRTPSPQSRSPGRGAKKVQNYLVYMNELLGQGNFSHVYRGQNMITSKVSADVEEQVAIKVIELSSLRTATLVNLLRSEIEILRTLRHPNILRCYDIISSANNCYIMTEICNEGDLETKVMSTRGTLEQRDCKKTICDIYLGLRYLAEQHIVHRDIKVANVFLKDGVAKIADFGFAKRAHDRFKDVNVGSPIYMPPEALLQSTYGPKTDIWAFGILIYEMLHGDTPLGFCHAEAELKANVVKPIQPRQFKASVPEDLRDLIMRCLEVDETKRIGALEIESHRYMQRIMRELGVQRQINRPTSNPASRDLVALQAETTKRSNSISNNQSSQIRFQPPSRFPQNQRDSSSDSTKKFKVLGSPRPETSGMSYAQPQINSTPRGNYHMNAANTPAQLVMRVERQESVSPNGQRIITTTTTTQPFSSQQALRVPTNPLLNKGSVQQLKRFREDMVNVGREPGTQIYTTPDFEQVKPMISSMSSMTTGVTESQPISFDQSLHLLHYCRLLYKTISMMNQNVRVAALRQTDYFVNWLFQMLEELEAKVNISSDPYNDKQQRMKNVLRQYHERYNSELHRNVSIEANIITVRQITDRLLLFLDNKIVGEPEYDHSELIQIGSYLRFVGQTTNILKRCQEVGQYSHLMSCRIDNFLNTPLQSFTVSSYISGRGGALGRSTY